MLCILSLKTQKKKNRKVINYLYNLFICVVFQNKNQEENYEINSKFYKSMETFKTIIN
jgi:hypothetical protein